MPYIEIKAYPRDEETKKRVAEKVQALIMKEMNCPAEAITVSIEYVKPAEWDEKVEIPQIKPQLDKMMIIDGKKQY